MAALPVVVVHEVLDLGHQVADVAEDAGASFLIWRPEPSVEIEHEQPPRRCGSEKSLVERNETPQPPTVAKPITGECLIRHKLMWVTRLDRPDLR
jgi:hypothetical protein